MTERNITIVDYTSATISSTAGTILARADSGSPSTLPVGARSFVGRVETAPVRMRGDGTAPTSSEGQLLHPGDPVLLDEQGITTMQFIRAIALDATIKGHFYNVELAVVLAMTAGDSAQRIRDDSVWAVATYPVTPIGALADDTSPDSVDEDDVGAVAMTLAREMYVTPKKRGAGDIITRYTSRASSSARLALGTPASGKKIRVVAVICDTIIATSERIVQIYFGTGSDIQTVAAKAIAEFILGQNTGGIGNEVVVFPDGAGPIGAVDEELSIANGDGGTGASRYTVHYREE